MDETDRKAEATAQEFVLAVGRSLDELEKRIVKVTGIEGNDDDAIVVGQDTLEGVEDLLGDEEMTGGSLNRLPPEPTRKETLGDGIDGGGKRMNAGKLRIELVPPEWLIALADVMTQGSKKYDPRNWEKGMKWSTMIGSMKRHIAKFEAGERYDGIEFNIEKGTTGCHHLAMIAWNALALLSYDLRGKGENDLPDDDGLKLFKRVNAETSDKGNSIHENV